MMVGRGGWKQRCSHSSAKISSEDSRIHGG